MNAAFVIRQSEQSHKCADCGKRMPKGSTIQSNSYENGYRQTFSHTRPTFFSDCPK